MTELRDRIRALSLEDWTAAFGEPPPAARDQEHPVFVIPAEDPHFGATTSRWVEFTGALCDDGGVLVGSYEFHPIVHRGPLRARLVAKIEGPKLSQLAPRLFGRSRPPQRWGFFVVESPPAA